MASKRLAYRVFWTVGASAIVAMLSLTAGCSDTAETPEQTTTTTTTTTAPPVEPTENVPDYGPTLDPSGPNSFGPTDPAPRDPGF